MQHQGLSKPAPGVTDILGLEACGEVVACGPGVPQDLMGKRLMSLLASEGGGIGTLAIQMAHAAGARASIAAMCAR